MPYREQDPRSLEYRYQNDVEFHALVDMIQSFYETGKYTPSDVRLAAGLAMVMYEMRTARPLYMHDGEISYKKPSE